MISPDPRETAEGMTQAILDIRRATAWLASRTEVDDQELGIFGISLGGITSSLAAGAEPRIQNVCTLLAGGDISRVAWESRELRDIRDKWLAGGGTKEQFFVTLLPIDPVAHAPAARGKRILMLNATTTAVPNVPSRWKARRARNPLLRRALQRDPHIFSALVASAAFAAPRRRMFATSSAPASRSRSTANSTKHSARRSRSKSTARTASGMIS
jgi:dienelactone hydrolase